MKIRVNRSVKGKAHIIFQAYELLLPSACSAFQLSSASPSMWAQNNHVFPHGQFLQGSYCIEQGHTVGILQVTWKQEGKNVKDFVLSSPQIIPKAPGNRML